MHTYTRAQVECKVSQSVIRKSQTHVKPTALLNLHFDVRDAGGDAHQLVKLTY